MTNSTFSQLNILLNGVLIEELSTVVHCTKAGQVGKRMCARLMDIIPRQQFLIAIQAAVGSKILARENLKPYRKDVTGKLVRNYSILRYVVYYFTIIKFISSVRRRCDKKNETAGSTGGRKTKIAYGREHRVTKRNIYRCFEKMKSELSIIVI